MICVRALPAASCTRASHRPWQGFNRAQGAVLECAVLVSRLNMLPPEKIEAELAYLEIAIAKTAGPREAEAWGWLMERIATLAGFARAASLIAPAALRGAPRPAFNGYCAIVVAFIPRTATGLLVRARE